MRARGSRFIRNGKKSIVPLLPEISLTQLRQSITFIINIHNMLQKKIPPRKAYVLTSGGLDSTLAVKMLQEQGVDVTGVYISTGFCINSHQKKSGRFDENKPDVFKVTEELGIDLEVIDISKDYISIITNPKYGWGKNVNPCIDCRIHMLAKTRELMEKNGFDFIATGEVIGQRPKSQRKDTAKLIAEKSGLKGFLVRPLSGQFHEETEPEKLGWINRGLLGRIEGRSRKEQIKMAQKYNIQNISAPAGGCCFLTDETYAVRFKDLLSDRKDFLKSNASQPLTMDTLTILATGRHVKIRKGLRLALGRNEGENKLIRHYAANHIVLEPEASMPGPTALLEFVHNEASHNCREEIKSIWGSGESMQTGKSEMASIEQFLENSGSPYASSLTGEDILICAKIMARYCDDKTSVRLKISVCLKTDDPENSGTVDLQIEPLKNSTVLNQRLVIKANEKNFL